MKSLKEKPFSVNQHECKNQKWFALEGLTSLTLTWKLTSQNIMENGHNGQNQDQSGQNSHHNVSIFISINMYFCSQGSQVFS